MELTRHLILIMIYLHSECSIELPALKTFEFDMLLLSILN